MPFILFCIVIVSGAVLHKSTFPHTLHTETICLKVWLYLLFWFVATYSIWYLKCFFQKGNTTTELLVSKTNPLHGRCFKKMKHQAELKLNHQTRWISNNTAFDRIFCWLQVPGVHSIQEKGKKKPTFVTYLGTKSWITMFWESLAWWQKHIRFFCLLILSF